MDKEDYSIILDGSNLEDLIFFGEMSMGGRYCIKMDMV